MAQIDVLLERALACGASDLHLRAGSPPLMRLHGRLQPLPEVDGLTGYEAALLAILTESQRQIFETAMISILPMKSHRSDAFG